MFNETLSALAQAATVTLLLHKENVSLCNLRVLFQTIPCANIFHRASLYFGERFQRIAVLRCVEHICCLGFCES